MQPTCTCRQLMLSELTFNQTIQLRFSDVRALVEDVRTPFHHSEDQKKLRCASHVERLEAPAMIIYELYTSPQTTSFLSLSPAFPFQMVLVVIFIIAVIIYRVLIAIPLFQNPVFRSKAPTVASISAAVVNLVLIMSLGRVYERLAYKLTQWGKFKRNQCSKLTKRSCIWRRRKILASSWNSDWRYSHCMLTWRPKKIWQFQKKNKELLHFLSSMM